jgi:TonB family protein
VKAIWSLQLGWLFFAAQGCANALQEDGRDYAPCTTAAACAITLRDVISGNIEYPREISLGAGVLLDIYLDDSANLTAVEIVESSGSKAFDTAVLRAIRRSAPFPELEGLPRDVFVDQFTVIKFIFNLPNDIPVATF